MLPNACWRAFFRTFPLIHQIISGSLWVTSSIELQDSSYSQMSSELGMKCCFSWLPLSVGWLCIDPMWYGVVFLLMGNPGKSAEASLTVARVSCDQGFQCSSIFMELWVYFHRPECFLVSSKCWKVLVHMSMSCGSLGICPVIFSLMLLVPVRTLVCVTYLLSTLIWISLVLVQCCVSIVTWLSFNSFTCMPIILSMRLYLYWLFVVVNSLFRWHRLELQSMLRSDVVDLLQCSWICTSLTGLARHKSLTLPDFFTLRFSLLISWVGFVLGRYQCGRYSVSHSC